MSGEMGNSSSLETNESFGMNDSFVERGEQVRFENDGSSVKTSDDGIETSPERRDDKSELPGNEADYNEGAEDYQKTIDATERRDGGLLHEDSDEAARQDKSYDKCFDPGDQNDEPKKETDETPVAFDESTEPQDIDNSPKTPQEQLISGFESTNCVDSNGQGFQFQEADEPSHIESSNENNIYLEPCSEEEATEAESGIRADEVGEDSSQLAEEGRSEEVEGSEQADESMQDVAEQNQGIDSREQTEKEGGETHDATEQQENQEEQKSVEESEVDLDREDIPVSDAIESDEVEPLKSSEDLDESGEEFKVEEETPGLVELGESEGNEKEAFEAYSESEEAIDKADLGEDSEQGNSDELEKNLETDESAESGFVEEAFPSVNDGVEQDEIQDSDKLASEPAVEEVESANELEQDVHRIIESDIIGDDSLKKVDSLPTCFDEMSESERSKELDALNGMKERDRAVYLRNVENETSLTPEVNEVITKNNGELQGLEHRLKTPSSVSEKVNRLDDFTPIKDMNDICRYTGIYTPETLAEGTNACLSDFQQRGYSIEKVKNTWDDVEPQYRGINTVIKSPSGNKFEVQFHTQESFDLKNEELHSLYEISRSLYGEDPLKMEVDDKMVSLSAKLQRPINIEKVVLR